MRAHKPRLLVVDDDPRLRELLRIILDDDEVPLEVFEAEDGQEAIELAERYHPDVVLLDVSLPVINGYAVCRRLKQDPTLRHTHVFMLTGNSSFDFGSLPDGTTSLPSWT